LSEDLPFFISALASAHLPITLADFLSILLAPGGMHSWLSCLSILLGASQGLFEDASVVRWFENKNQKVGPNMFCQHGKVPCAEFIRLR
jgi:hypothetical protein